MDEDKQTASLAQAVKLYKENLLAHIEYAQLTAKVAYAKYLALVKEGFSAEQALMLCKN